MFQFNNHHSIHRIFQINSSFAKTPIYFFVKTSYMLSWTLLPVYLAQTFLRQIWQINFRSQAVRFILIWINVCTKHCKFWTSKLKWKHSLKTFQRTSTSGWPFTFPGSSSNPLPDTSEAKHLYQFGYYSYLIKVDLGLGEDPNGSFELFNLFL